MPDTDLATVPAAEPTPLQLIQSAIAAKWSSEQIGDLVQLARQHKADLAAEQWAAAVTKFQALCPQIKKGRTAAGAKFSFAYASLDDVMYAIRPILKECGIVVTFTSKPAADGKGYEVTCNVRHGTHVEPTTITLPAPSLSSMDAVQQFGSVVSYGKRYALCAALNIVVSDEDDDAAGAMQRITLQEVDEIREILKEKGKQDAPFLQWVRGFQKGVTKIEDITHVNLARVMKQLEDLPTPAAQGKSQKGAKQ